MPFPFCATRLARLLGRLESHYRHWTRLPQSSLTLAFVLNLTRPKSELLLENDLLRQQFTILQRQAQKAHLTRRGHLMRLL